MSSWRKLRPGFLIYSIPGQIRHIDNVEDDNDDGNIKLFLDYYMLSESQRIFSDFAFRFSILTNYHKQSFFICETPDSTLDMFHEENAVNTFKDYINKGNSLIITANARKSNLIFNLYKSFSKNEVNVIDLTEISAYSLNNHFNFYSYFQEEN